jgi:sialate O-acetylesterase
MSKICQITGKKAMVGNNVSHSKRRTKRLFNVNLYTKKFFYVEEDCWIQLRVSAAGLKIINRVGLDAALKDAVDFPIGLITANWGGTRVESWMPLDALKEVVTPEQYEKKQTIHNIKPSELYCAMIAPIRNFTAKGFLWYQGCSNLGDNDHYDVMMARMVQQWREDWGDKENKMPFYYVMITPYTYSGSNQIAYPRFVECQIRALSKIPNSGMAATTDIGEEKCIHPAQKLEVGQRLAALAMAQTYGIKGFEPKGGQMESYKVENGRVKVKITNAADGLSPWYGEPVTGFEIAGADKKFVPAQANISANNEVTVWSDDVTEPVAVRYSFRNFRPGNLKNMYGIPVVPFRTDNWDDVM